MKPIKLLFLGLLFLVASCDTSSKNKKEKEEITSFDYISKKPINGILRGVIEIGTTGFNYFIIEVDTKKNWELKFKEYGKSLISEGMTTPLQIKSKLSAYIVTLKNYGVKLENIKILISSGALKEEITQEILEKLKEENIKAKLVTSKTEAIYGLMATIPEQFMASSFLIDMGSGNTKVAYKDDEGFVGEETYGSKYHQKGIEDKEVFDEIKTLIRTIPKNKRETCFIIGGIPYELSKLMENTEEKRYISLPINSSYFLSSKEKIGKRLKSGLNIYKAITDEVKCKRVVFDKKSNFAIGYLLEGLNE